jgi:hypothetical protein
MVRKAARTSAHRGAEGRAKAEAERERAAARAEARKNQGNIPFRFRVPVGETTQAIICDEEPYFFRFEHNLKNPKTGKWDTFTGCVAEYDNCPVCAATDKEAYYAMYLTVIDLTPFETKNGDEVEFSRKLLVVKPAQQKKFLRMYAKAEAKGNTLRGALIEFTRDSDKDASIGNEIELLEYVDEEELETYTRSWKDKDGKRHEEICHEVLDYDELFPEPDVDQLRALVGGEPVPGSREHERSALGRGSSRRTSRRDEEADDEEEEDEGKHARGRMRTGGKAPAKAATKTRPAARRAREEEEEGDDEDDEEDDEAAPPRRGRSSTKTRPAARRAREEEEETKPSRRGRPAAKKADDPPFDTDDDEEEEEDDEEEDTKASAKTRPAPRRGRSVAKKDDEEEEEEEEEEKVNRRNPRRVSMRRGR